MFRLFTWSKAAYIILMVLWGGLIALWITNIIPDYIWWISFVASIAAELGINALATRQYQKMLCRADTDIDGFVMEQDALAARQKGKLRQIVTANTIVALLEYERLDDVRNRLNLLSQMIPPNDFTGRFQYSSILMTLDMKCRNFQGIDFYVNDMNMCLSRFSAFNGGTEKLKRRCRFLIEMNLSSAEFFSRTPETLAAQDRNIAQRFLADLEQYNLLNRDNKVFPGALVTDYLVGRGLALAVLGDVENSRASLYQAASLPYGYPLIARAKRCLETGDINILFTAV